MATTDPTPQSQDLSKDYDNPLEKPETSYINSVTVLKDRIRHHYEICSDYYLSLWYSLSPSQNVVFASQYSRMSFSFTKTITKHHKGASTSTTATSPPPPKQKKTPKSNSSTFS